MMQKIIINLHEHGEQIGISSAFSSGIHKENPNSIYIHFLYSQEFKINNSVHDDFLNSVFSFTLLEAQLSSDLIPKNSDIKVKKI